MSKWNQHNFFLSLSLFEHFQDKTISAETKADKRMERETERKKREEKRGREIFIEKELVMKRKGQPIGGGWVQSGQ